MRNGRVRIMYTNTILVIQSRLNLYYNYKMVKWNYLVAGLQPVTIDILNCDIKGCISGSRHGIGTVTVEAEIPPVEGSVVIATPRGTGCKVPQGKRVDCRRRWGRIVWNIESLCSGVIDSMSQMEGVFLVVSQEVSNCSSVDWCSIVLFEYC